MAFFIVCAALGWMAMGAALITRVNRCEFEAQKDDGRSAKSYLDDGEFKELLRSEGAWAMAMMTVVALVAWPILLYMLIKDGRK